VGLVRKTHQRARSFVPVGDCDRSAGSDRFVLHSDYPVALERYRCFSRVDLGDPPNRSGRNARWVSKVPKIRDTLAYGKCLCGVHVWQVTDASHRRITGGAYSTVSVTAFFADRVFAGFRCSARAWGNTFGRETVATDFRIQSHRSLCTQNQPSARGFFDSSGGKCAGA
jgi:hypothetical protein